ncbi:hypothetical protein CFOL_v3_16880 [Cephalotus follicularis]|uniref:Bifunctional inhibitor/plant lipid transfer protein/seed storage helical domain-containing protein n=1 Tax=Cephalotus follicularis TaxID=3775 RepID=A0A1Q3BZE5_CEPFO|nr:hypothetical protein CFOL_v3_16880 [Cephalotus follicularis]
MVIMLALVVGVVWEIPMAMADMSPCQNLLVSECRAVIFGRTPSPTCCQRVRIAAIIGVKRTVKQIQNCGRIVPHNFKCGSDLSLIY